MTKEKEGEREKVRYGNRKREKKKGNRGTGQER